MKVHLPFPQIPLYNPGLLWFETYFMSIVTALLRRRCWCCLRSNRQRGGGCWWWAPRRHLPSWKTWASRPPATCACMCPRCAKPTSAPSLPRFRPSRLLTCDPCCPAHLLYFSGLALSLCTLEHSTIQPLTLEQQYMPGPMLACLHP